MAGVGREEETSAAVAARGAGALNFSKSSIDLQRKSRRAVRLEIPCPAGGNAFRSHAIRKTGIHGTEEPSLSRDLTFCRYIESTTASAGESS